MTNTNTIENLSEGIERLVREHVAAIHASARAAIERAFTSTVASGTKARAQRAKRATGQKRAAADIAALGERFYVAVSAKPGETMVVLAREVGVSARELHRSVTLLRRAGRVRAVGHRRFTRYFPTAA